MSPSNEITAIPQRLELLEVTGSVVTIDTMGTQTKITEKIIEKGPDYILTVKENQPKLYADIARTFKQKGIVSQTGKNGSALPDF